MSSNTKLDPESANGNQNGIHQPRARRPVSPQLNRAYNGELQRPRVAVPERTPASTPAPPDDAPPSVKATSAARRELRQKSKARLFPTVEYYERVSYFDPRSDYSNFRGFFVLFWVGLAIMVITSMLRNLKETGTILSFKQWVCIQIHKRVYPFSKHTCSMGPPHAPPYV